MKGGIMKAVEALALVGGHVDEELLIRNEYLAAENKILKSKLKKPVQFNNYERIQLAKIGKRMGLKALKEVSCIVKPETILKWFRRLVAKKFDGSPYRKKYGRPPISIELEKLIIRFAEENPGWGYDRIVGALSNLGYSLSDQTVGNILKRNGIPPAPERDQNTTWATFIRNHQDVLAACDFFTAEVITPVGLITYYVLFFIHLASRKIHIAGVTPHPNEDW
jgi:putative transposase